MKKQTDSNTKAHIIRSAFYVLLLLAVWVIPFALGQRNSNNGGGHAALAVSAPTKNAAPVASDYLKVPTAPSSVRFSWETQHLATKLLAGWPMVTGQTGARAIRVAPNPKSPGGSCTWSIVAPYPLIIESPSVCSDGTFAYAAGGRDAATFNSTDAFNRYDPLLDTWTGLANLPTAVSDARSVYAANTNSIYVFGGITDFAPFPPLSQTSSKSTMSRPAPGARVPPCLLSGFSLPVFTTTPTGKSMSPAESTAPSLKLLQPGSMIQSPTHGTPPLRPSRWRWVAVL
jgi:hypothetical protein